MSRTQQIRRHVLIGAVFLACVHIVARLAWSIVPMFRQCTDYLVTRRMLSRDTYQVSTTSRVFHDDYATFENYPYDDTSTLVFSHLYGVAVCVALVATGLIVWFLMDYFGQPHGQRMTTWPLLSLINLVVVCGMTIVSVGTHQYDGQLQVLCVPGF